MIGTGAIPTKPSMLETCPSCQVGQLKMTQSTYVHVYEGTLVHIPNVTTWKCDVCGLSFYDPSLLRRVEILVGEAGPPPNRYIPDATDSSAPESPSSLDDIPGDSQPPVKA